jgi:hypothetical protein
MADWNFNNLTQASGGVVASQGSPLAGYVWENQNTEHVIFIGANDNHIYELYYNDKWWQNDLTKAANGEPYGGSNLTAFAFESEGTEHVFYAGRDGHVHELYYNGRWWQNDLTKVATGNPPNIRSVVTGFAWENQKTEHVFYVGTDSAIHELLYDGHAWHDTNLNAHTGNPPAWKAGKIAAYVWEGNNTKHAAYCGTDGHIHELYYDGQWHHSDMTKVANGPANVSSNLTGFAWENKGSEHVFYVGPDGHIHELWYDNGHPTWHDSDLNADPAGAPLPITDNLAGYAWEKDNSEHIMYSPTPRGAIQELWHNGQWSTSDVWGRSVGAPFPRSGGELAGYAWENQNSEHVIYVDGNGHVCELYFSSLAPPSPVPPVISVACANGVYTVTGSKFVPNATVYIRVVDRNAVSYEGPPYIQGRTDGGGSLNPVKISNKSLHYDGTGPSPAAGTSLYFSANDGRQNQQNNDALWSNIVTVQAC